MTKWFEDRSMGLKKCYWAFVAPRPLPSTGRIKCHLEKIHSSSLGDRVAIVENETENSQLSITEYTTIESVGDEVAWLALYPITGRMHQLRVHCAVALKS